METNSTDRKPCYCGTCDYCAFKTQLLWERDPWPGYIYATQHLLGHASPVTTQGYVMESPIRLRQAAATAWVA